jgi:hypothetical protein
MLISLTSSANSNPFTGSAIPIADPLSPNTFAKTILEVVYRPLFGTSVPQHHSGRYAADHYIVELPATETAENALELLGTMLNRPSQIPGYPALIGWPDQVEGRSVSDRQRLTLRIPGAPPFKIVLSVDPTSYCVSTDQYEHPLNGIRCWTLMNWHGRIYLANYALHAEHQDPLRAALGEEAAAVLDTSADVLIGLSPRKNAARFAEVVQKSVWRKQLAAVAVWLQNRDPSATVRTFSGASVIPGLELPDSVALSHEKLAFTIRMTAAFLANHKGLMFHQADK